MFDYSVLIDHIEKDYEIKLENKKLMIALVGAGGKTSAMYALGKHFAGNGLRVLVTTTTKVMMPEKNEADRVLLGDRTDEFTISDGELLFKGLSVDESDKVTGYNPDVLSGWDESLYDVLIYEADGAMRKPIKAPREGEPQIADGTTHVIGVIGLDAIGQIMSEDTVHRSALFSQVTDCHLGDHIDVSHVFNLVIHPEGLFKNINETSRKILLLTKMDDDSRIDYANEIKMRLKDWNGIVIAI